MWFLSIAAVGVTRRWGQPPMLARNRAIVQTLRAGLYLAGHALKPVDVQSYCLSQIM